MAILAMREMKGRDQAVAGMARTGVRGMGDMVRRMMALSKMDCREPLTTDQNLHQSIDY